MTQAEIDAFNALPNDERLRQMFGDEILEPLRPYADTRLPFGKHRFRRLDEVPVSYLYWMRDNLKGLRPSLREAIDGYLKSFGL